MEEMSAEMDVIGESAIPLRARRETRKDPVTEAPHPLVPRLLPIGKLGNRGHSGRSIPGTEVPGYFLPPPRGSGKMCVPEGLHESKPVFQGRERGFHCQLRRPVMGDYLVPDIYQSWSHVQLLIIHDCKAPTLGK